MKRFRSPASVMNIDQYINDTSELMAIYKIAEVYLHLRLDFYSARTVKLGDRLNEISREHFSGFMLSDTLVTDVTIAKGSAKFNINIYGSVIKNCISGYGDLRSGLIRVVGELKTISGNVIETGRREELDIDLFLLRTEKRTGLPGHLKRTLDSINQLRQRMPVSLKITENSDSTELMTELANMLAILSKPEREALFDSLPWDLRENLPEPDTSGINHLLNLYAFQTEK